MDKNNSTTFKNINDVKRQWFLIDAKGKTLGRLASEIAKILRGKHRADFTPFVDCGDGVVVINAEKVTVTGAKRSRKIYRYYTGSMSGLREVPYDTMIARRPTYPLERAVKGMMPKSRLGGQQLRRLRVFAGAEHDLSAQQPIQVNC
jgi:large subunit ribosomal protein L13